MQVHYRLAFDEFQSTSPVRGTTTLPPSTTRQHLFQSTSPVRGTTREHMGGVLRPGISIHVPREGDDVVGTFGTGHT